MSGYKDCSGASGDDSGFFAQRAKDDAAERVAALQARVAELEAEKAEHYEHARTATETALKTCIRARERQAAQIVDLNECLRVAIVDTGAAQTHIATLERELAAAKELLGAKHPRYREYWAQLELARSEVTALRAAIDAAVKELEKLHRSLPIRKSATGDDIGQDVWDVRATLLRAAKKAGG